MAIKWVTCGYFLEDRQVYVQAGYSDHIEKYPIDNVPAKVIAWLEGQIEDLKEEIETYTEYIENFQCPACDCFDCYTDCGIESLQASIDHAESTIEEYTEILFNIQEGKRNEKIYHG